MTRNDPGTQDEPIMAGAIEASAESKLAGLREQSAADHPDDSEAAADVEARRADLEHDEGSNQPAENRPTAEGADPEPQT